MNPTGRNLLPVCWWWSREKSKKNGVGKLLTHPKHAAGTAGVEAGWEAWCWSCTKGGGPALVKRSDDTRSLTLDPSEDSLLETDCGGPGDVA